MESGSSQMVEEESMWKYFPMKSNDDVLALEEKLKSSDFFQSCVSIAD